MAIVIGFVFGKIIFRTYKSDLYETLQSSKLYLIENGEYESIDIMREENINNNYVYYKDGGKYKSVIGIRSLNISIGAAKLKRLLRIENLPAI